MNKQTTINMIASLFYLNLLRTVPTIVGAHHAIILSHNSLRKNCFRRVSSQCCKHSSVIVKKINSMHPLVEDRKRKRNGRFVSSNSRKDKRRQVSSPHHEMKPKCIGESDS